MATDPICGMQVDAKSALRLSWQGEDYFFCSDHCLKKFRQQNNIVEACPSCSAPAPGTPWWRNKLIVISLIYLALFFFAPFLPLFRPLATALTQYLKIISWPVTLGLLLGGVIDWAIPREYISQLLARPKKRTIIYAVLTGFLMSACSHGILALAIQLYKKGASVPAIVAFLLASPWANLPLTLMMVGFFGWRAALVVGGAVVIALISGYIFAFLAGRRLVESNPNTIIMGDDFSFAADIRARLKVIKWDKSFVGEAVRGIWQGALSLSNMVLWWILLGMLLASLVAAYLPPDFMHHYMGTSLLGLLVTLFLATIIEICSEGSAPLAFEIFRQTGALGNSFTFLMAGVVTDYTEIGLLWTNVGWRTALWLPLVTVPQVLLLALIFNYFF